MPRHATKRPKRLRFFEVSTVRTNEWHYPRHPTARPCGRFLTLPMRRLAVTSLPSALAAITPLSSPRTQRACARWCPAFIPLSIEFTDMSLRLLRCAPSPLRVPGRVLGVGSLRTLSRPDTSPGFDTWSLHSFGFHPLSQIGSPGGHRVFLQRRSLTRRSFETVAPSHKYMRWCGSTREWCSLTARYRRTGTIKCIRRFRRYCNLLD